MTAQDTPQRRATIRLFSRDLPFQPNRLVGRIQDVRAVLDLLALPETRLVTLIGPAGVGKSRLGHQVTAEFAEHFHGNVSYLSLDTEPAGGSSLQRVLHTVEQHTLVSDERSPVPFLLMIDTMDREIAGGATLAGFLAANPHVRILATSRTPLEIQSEREYSVRPLSVTDTDSDEGTAAHAADESSPAQRLFIDRAKAVRYDFDPSDADRETINQICRELDGLPLAIEIAASWIRLLPLPAILTRIRESHGASAFPLPESRAADRPDRHRSMQDAIRWSYDLLTPDEQRVFRSLSIFAGSCTINAAASVCNAVQENQPLAVEDAFLHVLVSLVAHNMIAPINLGEPDARLRLLKSFRAFGLQQLIEHGEWDDLCIRHASYYRHVVLPAWPGGQSSSMTLWLNSVENEADNLGAAFNWSIYHEAGHATALHIGAAIWRFWARRGDMGDEGLWLTRVLEASLRKSPSEMVAIAPAEIWSAALFGAGFFAQMHQDHENAHRFFQQSRDIGRLLGDDQGQAYALVLMSLVALRQGDEAIRPFIEESIRLFQSAGNQRWLSLAYNFLGTAFLFEDNPDAAEKALLTSASLYESTDDPWGWGLTLGSLGALAIWRKEWALAETRLTESLRLLQNTKDNESLLGTLDLLAYLHRREDSDQSGGEGRESGLVSMGIAGNRTVNRTSIPWPRQSAELYTTVRKWVTARVMAPQIAENLQAPGSHAALSDRERQVLQLIDAGKNNIEIADALYISVNTVKTHISHIFSKVGARNRVEATNAVRPRPRLTVIRSDHDAVR